MVPHLANIILALMQKRDDSNLYYDLLRGEITALASPMKNQAVASQALVVLEKILSIEPLAWKLPRPGLGAMFRLIVKMFPYLSTDSSASSSSSSSNDINTNEQHRLFAVINRHLRHVNGELRTALQHPNFNRKVYGVKKDKSISTASGRDWISTEGLRVLSYLDKLRDDFGYADDGAFKKNIVKMLQKSAAQDFSLLPEPPPQEWHINGPLAYFETASQRMKLRNIPQMLDFLTSGARELTLNDCGPSVLSDAESCFPGVKDMGDFTVYCVANTWDKRIYVKKSVNSGSVNYRARQKVKLDNQYVRKVQPMQAKHRQALLDLGFQYTVTPDLVVAGHVSMEDVLKARQMKAQARGDFIDLS